MQIALKWEKEANYFYGHNLYAGKMVPDNLRDKVAVRNLRIAYTIFSQDAVDRDPTQGLPWRVGFSLPGIAKLHEAFREEDEAKAYALAQVHEWFEKCLIDSGS